MMPVHRGLKGVTWHLRDIAGDMCAAWEAAFADLVPPPAPTDGAGAAEAGPEAAGAGAEAGAEGLDVRVSRGDAFALLEEAPQDGSAAALVSPANSFGFMDGGFDMRISVKYGWQLQRRLQALLQAEHDGELPVGQALIVPTLGTDPATTDGGAGGESEGSGVGDGGDVAGAAAKTTAREPIELLICAPTMRVPMDVSETANAYLAMRAIIRCVRQWNDAVDATTLTTAPSDDNDDDDGDDGADGDDGPQQQRISAVVVTGLGTAVGRMPFAKAAEQMRKAFEACAFVDVNGDGARAPEIRRPADLGLAIIGHGELIRDREADARAFPRGRQPGELLFTSS